MSKKKKSTQRREFLHFNILSDRAFCSYVYLFLSDFCQRSVLCSTISIPCCMSHHLWWSEELVNDVPGEVFAPPIPLSPRSELISKLDPLDVLKSEEYIISCYPGKTDKVDPPRKEFYVDFNDPASASVSAMLVCHQVTIDSNIRSDDEAVRQLLGNTHPVVSNVFAPAY